MVDKLAAKGVSLFLVTFLFYPASDSPCVSTKTTLYKVSNTTAADTGVTVSALTISCYSVLDTFKRLLPAKENSTYSQGDSFKGLHTQSSITLFTHGEWDHLPVVMDSVLV